MDREQIRTVLLKQCQLDPGLPVIAGVSGGPDSLCLLDLLVQLGFQTIAAHFNHRLRSEAGRDEETVRSVAQRLKVPLVIGSDDVAAWARQHKRSIEDAARSLRYQFLFEQARQAGAQALAVGHTADDQVETLLMHLVQGSGLGGIAAMPYHAVLPDWDAALPLVRPLLGWWRSQTLEYCKGRDLPFVLDETNQDPSYTRNRVRLQLIPMLETYNPSIRQALWRLSQSAAGELELARYAANQAWDQCLSEQHPQWIALWLVQLQQLSPPFLRAVLRQAFSLLLPDASQRRELGFEDIERASRFIHKPSRSGGLDLVQGLRLVVEPATPGWARLLVLAQSLDDHPLPGEGCPRLTSTAETPLEIPGLLDLGEGWQLSTEWITPDSGIPGAYQPWQVWLDGAAIAGDLILRTARSGDRFKPAGLQGHSVKLADFWINEKVPRRVRRTWPLVCCGDEIIWVPGYRPAHAVQATQATRLVLHLAMQKNAS